MDTLIQHTMDMDDMDTATVCIVPEFSADSWRKSVDRMSSNAFWDKERGIKEQICAGWNKKLVIWEDFRRVYVDWEQSYQAMGQGQDLFFSFNIKCCVMSSYAICLGGVMCRETVT